LRSIDRAMSDYFFSEFPGALYYVKDGVVIGDCIIRYFISFRNVCSVCRLKGHEENFCPFINLSKVAFEIYGNVVLIGKMNSKFLDLRDAPFSGDILKRFKSEKFIEEANVMVVYLKEKRIEWQSKVNKDMCYGDITDSVKGKDIY